MGNSALVIACAKGDSKISVMLIAHPCIDVYLLDGYEQYPVCVSSFFGHLDIVAALVAHSKDRFKT
jgi:hypothetical protein